MQGKQGNQEHTNRIRIQEEMELDRENNAYPDLTLTPWHRSLPQNLTRCHASIYVP